MGVRGEHNKLIDLIQFLLSVCWKPQELREGGCTFVLVHDNVLSCVS